VGVGVIFEFFIWANLDLMASMHSGIVTDNLSKCFFWGALQWAISVLGME
jgi:formylmethanofuran dehydrogenase subunit A